MRPGRVRQGRKISVYGICRDEGGALLLVRGAVESNFPGRWNLPGGGIEHGEAPLDALAREFFEETGITIEVGRLIDVRFDVVSHRDGRLTHFDRIVFEVRAIGGTLRAETDGGTDRAEWFSAEAVGNLPLIPWLAAFLGYADDKPVATGTVAAAGTMQRDPDVSHVQRFSAYGVVRDPDGRILLTRIASGYPGAGTWHLPGGGTDFGESARDALVREIHEETGQSAVVGDLLEVVHTHNPQAYGPERRPLDWHTVRSIFAVTVPSPIDPVVRDLGGSTDQVGWFTPAEIGQLTLNRLAQSILGRYVK